MPAVKNTAVGFMWFREISAMAMGKRIPMSPKAPAMSHRFKGQLLLEDFVGVIISTVSGKPNELGDASGQNAAGPDDHDLGCFDQRRSRFPNLQAKIAAGVFGNNCRHALTAHFERDLRQETKRMKSSDSPHQLVAPADNVFEPGGLPALGCPVIALARAIWFCRPVRPAALLEQEPVDFRGRNPVMPSRCLH